MRFSLFRLSVPSPSILEYRPRESNISISLGNLLSAWLTACSSSINLSILNNTRVSYSLISIYIK